jgi:hypothetical protein
VGQALWTIDYMKTFGTIVFGLYSLFASGQGRITDDLLYDLTKETIKNFTETRVKLLRGVTIPTIFWDANKKEPKTGIYFSEGDLDYISNQVNNPIIKSWDVETFRKIRNVRFISKIRGNNCLQISLPIVSEDEQTIVICYETVDKHAGAGFLTVWKKGLNNEWTREKDDVIWITSADRASPQHELNSISVACANRKLNIFKQ